MSSVDLFFDVLSVPIAKVQLEARPVLLHDAHITEVSVHGPDDRRVRRLPVGRAWSACTDAGDEVRGMSVAPLVVFHEVEPVGVKSARAFRGGGEGGG